MNGEVWGIIIMAVFAIGAYHELVVHPKLYREHCKAEQAKQEAQWAKEEAEEAKRALWVKEQQEKRNADHNQ